MLRAVASTLLLVLLAPLGLPAATTVEHNLPACCRANGAHHCTALLQPTDADRAFHSQQRCPYSHPVVLPHFAQPEIRSDIPATEETHPFLQEFVPGVLASDQHGRRSDRGPPIASH